MFKEKTKNDKSSGINIHLSWLQIFFIAIVLLAAGFLFVFRLIPSATPLVNQPHEELFVDVDSAQGWQGTGLRLEAGQNFTVEYLEGDWSMYPMDSMRYTADGGIAPCGQSHCVEPLPSYTTSGLIGRIGDGEAFVVGGYLETTANDSGMLQLRINDAGTYDNEGIIRVRVSN